LLPALFALVVVANVIMAAAHDWGPTAWASLAAIFYFGNWISIADGHLSLTAGSLGPWLGHTWSLAIEEQFYLLWPMLLILFLRWGRQRPLVLFACAGVAASVIERLLLWPGPASPQSIHSATDASLQRIYHGTDTRMDALLLGSLLALGAFRWARRGFGRCAFAGALMLGTGTVLTGQEAHFVAAPTLAAVGGLVMLASLDQKPDQLLGRVLAVPPLRFTGRISYGLYIWHVPFKTLFMPHMAGDPLWMRGIVLFGFAYGAALLSHRYVEQPFLRLKRRVPTPSSLHREDEFPAVTVAA
jgi:peptidoglycan/LPS O-acetylase OafA/YrhL